MSTDVQTTELEPLEHERWTPDQIVAGLTALALNGGNASRAAEQLQAAGLEISHDTLTRFKNSRFPRRYRDACDRLAPQVENVVVNYHRELAVQAAHAAQRAVALETERLAAGEVKDAAKSAQNLATTAGIAVDKVLSLTGRPTSITEHRTPEQAFKRLQSLVPGLVFEGSAEEMPEGLNATDTGAQPLAASDLPSPASA